MNVIMLGKTVNTSQPEVIILTSVKKWYRPIPLMQNTLGVCNDLLSKLFNTSEDQDESDNVCTYYWELDKLQRQQSPSAKVPAPTK